MLQYGWIGEVSEAARDRLRGSLQASLNRLSLDFSAEIATAVRAVDARRCSFRHFDRGNRNGFPLRAMEERRAPSPDFSAHRDRRTAQ